MGSGCQPIRVTPYDRVALIAGSDIPKDVKRRVDTARAWGSVPSVKALAAKLGTSDTSLKNWLKTPSKVAPHIRDIADATGVSVEFLLGQTNEIARRVEPIAVTDGKRRRATDKGSPRSLRRADDIALCAEALAQIEEARQTILRLRG